MVHSERLRRLIRGKHPPEAYRLQQGDATIFDADRVTTAGGREENEDACSHLRIGHTSCWVVADGLGGHHGGQLAATLAVEAALESFRLNPAVAPAALQAHLQAAHDAILRRQSEDPSLGQMQSTLAILVSDGLKAMWAHAGDSRLYYFKGGAIAFQTRDHSVSQSKVDGGQVPADQIRKDEDRNRLLQSVGKQSYFRPTVLDSPKRLANGDAFLLCVDGFWAKVLEAEMEIDLAKAGTAKDWITGMERRLSQRLTRGDDNYTAIAVRVANSALPPPPMGAARRPTSKNATQALSVREAAKFGAALCVGLILALSLRFFPPASSPQIAAVRTPKNRKPSPPQTTNVPHPLSLKPNPAPSGRPGTGARPPAPSATSSDRLASQTPRPPAGASDLRTINPSLAATTPKGGGCHWATTGYSLDLGKRCYGGFVVSERGIEIVSRTDRCPYMWSWKYDQIDLLRSETAGDQQFLILRSTDGTVHRFETSTQVSVSQLDCVNSRLGARR